MPHSSTLTNYTAPKKIPPFNPVNTSEKVPVKCVDVYDGDTVKLAFHLFNNPELNIVVFSCRLIGINACEIKSSNSEEKAKAVKCRDHLRELCLNKCVYAKFRADVKEKYGRQLVELYLDKDDIESVNHHLVSNDYAVKFMDDSG